jgi:Tfp pilus assembly protein PilW
MMCMLAAGLAATIGGCGIADFDIEQPVAAQTIQGSGIPAPLAAIFPLPLNLDLDSKIKAKDTGPIDGVTLSSLTLHITSSGGDWSFVTRIDVSVESTKAGTTLQKVKIASVSSPGAVQTLTFDVEHGVNLKPYIDEGSQVDSSGSGTQPTQDVTFDGKGVFTVHPL